MLLPFISYLIGVFALGWISHRFLKGGSFIKEYFLGNRQLGTWVLAISFAATAISGGSFMGFPALIYSNGYVMALWIAGYMLVPLVTMVILGKRINQASRLSGAVTIPDLLRDRYASPAVGLLTSLVLILFLVFNMVAQFKAGGYLMREAWLDDLVDWGLVSKDQEHPKMVSLFVMKLELGYLLGLAFFVLMVVAYTTYGGFWGVTLTDLLEGMVMLAGAVILAVLACQKAGGLAGATTTLYNEDPALVYGPGPKGYLPLGLALSFFFQWTIVGIGQPGQMVRLMSFRDTKSLSRALCVCAGYYTLTYLSLLTAFLCARALYPPASLHGVESDQIMPFLVRALGLPVSRVLAGFLLAAPYAAIMSTVAANLLVTSSSLVRDIYQRLLNPRASTLSLKTLSYGSTMLVGIIAFLGALNPPHFLQYIIVFSTGGIGVSLLAPVSLGLFWRRASRQGALWGMAGGVLCILTLYVIGWTHPLHGLFERPPASDAMQPWYPLGLDPILWSLAVSFALTIGVSLAAEPPDPGLLEKYFFTPSVTSSSPRGET